MGMYEFAKAHSNFVIFDLNKTFFPLANMVKNGLIYLSEEFLSKLKSPLTPVLRQGGRLTCVSVKIQSKRKTCNDFVFIYISYGCRQGTYGGSISWKLCRKTLVLTTHFEFETPEGNLKMGTKVFKNISTQTYQLLKKHLRL